MSFQPSLLRLESPTLVTVQYVGLELQTAHKYVLFLPTFRKNWQAKREFISNSFCYINPNLPVHGIRTAAGVRKEWSFPSILEIEQDELLFRMATALQGLSIFLTKFRSTVVARGFRNLHKPSTNIPVLETPKTVENTYDSPEGGFKTDGQGG